MYTSSLGQHHNNLAKEIHSELESIAHEFSLFQKSSNLDCLSGCGRCCFKSDIYCAPYELFPLALDLLERGKAQNVYERLQSFQPKEACFLLNVTDESQYQGHCTEYKFRPLVCRTFGVSARHGKNETVSFSICKPLKEVKKEASEKLSETSPHIAFIDFCKNRMGSIDPLLLEEEFPIHESLKRILEKVLLYESFN